MGTLDSPVEAPLKRRVTGGFIVAVLLTIVISIASWRSAWLSANDANWVVHTYAVLETLKVTQQHVIEMETSARTFALMGQSRCWCTIGRRGTPSRRTRASCAI